MRKGFLQMVLVVAALLAGVAGAVEPEGGVLVVPPGEGELVEHDFGGVKRPARLMESAWVKQGGWAAAVIPFGAVNMLDDYPTIDFMVEIEQPGAIDVRYLGGMQAGDWARCLAFSATGGVTHVRREIGHSPYWCNWIDVRKVTGIKFAFARNSWKDTNAVQRVWISDFRFTKDDSWRGTERDRRYREWLDFCDHYEPDFSDSSKYLEPPAEGRLKKPLKLVENHVAKAEIVAPKDFYNSLELAARDLQFWIEKMTGAKLPIVEKPSGTMPIRVFLNDPAAQRRWKKDVEWLKGGKDVDGYFVHTDGNDIHIGCAVPNDAKWSDMKGLGLPFDACPVGAFRGAIALLENNSTILFASLNKELGTVYDETPDFTVVWGEGRSRPATCGRGWLCGHDMRNTRAIDLFGLDMWSARNKGNIRMPHRLSGHGNYSGEMIEYVPDKDPYRTFDGKKRIPLGYYNGQICLGAPDALALAISNGIVKTERLFAQPYPVASIGFWNEDNHRVCVCDACTKPIVGDDGTVLTSSKQTDKEKMIGEGEALYRSTQYMRFVNGLADGVAAKYPGVKTEILAYLFQSTVPKCRISPNVAWTYCPYFARWSYNAPMFHPVSNHIFNNFTAMQEKGGEMHVYDYHAFSPPLNSAFTAMAEASAADYGWYADHGAKMTGAEFVGSIAKPENPIAMMNGWLFNQVGWDADYRKVEALRKYYLRRLYREGAPAVEAYLAPPRMHALNRRERPALLPKPEATAQFERYRDKIANPIARRHYQILMDIVTGANKKK